MNQWSVPRYVDTAQHRLGRRERRRSRTPNYARGRRHGTHNQTRHGQTGLAPRSHAESSHHPIYVDTTGIRHAPHFRQRQMFSPTSGNLHVQQPGGHGRQCPVNITTWVQSPKSTSAATGESEFWLTGMRGTCTVSSLLQNCSTTLRVVKCSQRRSDEVLVSRGRVNGKPTTL